MNERLGKIVTDSGLEQIALRYRAIRPMLSDEFKRMGFASRTAYIRAATDSVGRSRNTIWRWWWKFEEREDMRDLANRPPGPPPGRPVKRPEL